MTPEPTAQAETACNSDDSTADGIEDDHTGQHERQDNAGCPALPVALDAYEDDFRDPEQERGGEQRSAGLREPKPTAKPSPIASDSSHGRMLVQGNKRHLAFHAPLGVPVRQVDPAVRFASPAGLG
jgi:hypothetical protein